MGQTSLCLDGPVNRGRELELDVIKGLAILFMLLVHCFQTFAMESWERTWPNRLIILLGSPPRPRCSCSA